MTEDEFANLKLSDLVRLAVADLERCEADPTYEIVMSVWHEAEEDGRCHVCLAGAVMAQSLGVSRNVSQLPTDFSKLVRNRLFALDSIRVGEVRQAIIGVCDDLLSVSDDYGDACVDVVPYCTDPQKFKRGMMAIADDLEANGY